MTALHLTILSPAQHALLPRLAKVLDESGMYLAGGTAFALYRGHRLSVDFDVIMTHPISWETIKHDFESWVRALSLAPDPAETPLT